MQEAGVAEEKTRRHARRKNPPVKDTVEQI